MSPTEREIIRRKLLIIAENLKALEPIMNMTSEEYISDVYKRKATERLLQELIEAAIDINSHLIVQTGHATPDDYYEGFIKAGEVNIIPADLAEKLAPSAGLRNRLVHEYDLLDHLLVLEAIKMAEKLYPAYIKEIETFISGSI
ncbi:MAG: hypothetical protein B6D35_05455 [Candidatus Brocadia sp. UTAMX2]|nr:MAG: hypothetical protein B6D35_05455 [Candidatus Brocadia sp. UTAMX2]